MTFKITPAQEAYGALLDEKVGKLSEAAGTILDEADRAATATNLVSWYCYQPEEYDEAMERMRLAATRITERDHESLTEIVRGGFLAALSVDINDETPAPYGVYGGNWHWYYRMFSGMVNDVLEEGVPEPVWSDEEVPQPNEDGSEDENEEVRRAVAEGW